MQLHINTTDTFTCVEIVGRLDTLTSESFDAQIATIIQKARYVLINFNKCSYLSSTGIRSLMILSKKLAVKEQGGLVLAAVPPDVRHVLEVAGLDKVFAIAGSVKDGQNILIQLQEASLRCGEMYYGKWLFEYQPDEDRCQTALLWHNQGIASYNELNIAIGIGSRAKVVEPAKQDDALFMTTTNCAAFVPLNQHSAPDFMITAEPSTAAVFVKEACSFNNKANAFIKLKNTEPITWNEMLGAIHEFSIKTYKESAVTGFIVASQHNGQAHITTGCFIEKDFENIAQQQPLSFVNQDSNAPETPFFAAISLKLEKLIIPHYHFSMRRLLMENIHFENVLGLMSVDPDEVLVKPMAWLFIGNKTADAASMRPKITAPSDFLSTPYKVFLAQHMYRESSRLEIKELQGGFSAQTFHVTSWDAEDRKLSPTVLKIADRDMINRETKRCTEYAMPYIFNNSAMIRGIVFFGEYGALQYNFVGIGGEKTNLKWLTHYFLEWMPEQLEPLFDKIFLTILKPWYGQAVKKTIYPYSDHDPTKIFFPHIFETAKDVFGVSADDQFVEIKETGRKMLNPYWVLKHEYPEKADFPIDYNTSICHGDLNMQNILLDEQMNVYLIDFSETRPRSVVSDFARLEAIFMTEFLPVKSEEDLLRIVNVFVDFYEHLKLNDSHCVADHDNKEIRRSLYLSKLMRKYALQSAGNNMSPFPYFIAMLEWVLPVVCYQQATLLQKRLSFILAAILIEKLEKGFNL